MAEQRVALVTGGGSGIGAEVATRLAAGGAMVWIAGRREAALAGVVGAIEKAGGKAGGKARAIKCDVAVPADITRMAAEIGRCDILVNNAGVARSAPIAKLDDAHWAEAIAVNLTGTFLCTRAFLPGMMDRGWDGKIVEGARVYSAHNYQTGLSIMLAFAVVGLWGAWGIRETHCRYVNLAHGIRSRK